MAFLSPRLQPRFGRVEAIVLAAYSLLLAWTVAHHAPWADEAQAWLLARDSSLFDLFRTNLHYEGTPGLWHLLLWVLCRLHISYAGMHWFAAAIAVAGVWVFLRYAPFPLIFRIALPFTFYLLYQYAVIARSYVAVPLLVFVAAALISRPARNLVAIATVLGLLANLCTQSFVLSAGFVFILLLHLRSDLRRNSQSLAPRRIAAACMILSAFWAFAVWTAAPAASNSYLNVSTRLHRFAAPPPSGTGSSIPAANAPPAASASGSRNDARQSCEPVSPAQVYGNLLASGLSNSWLLSLVTLGIIFTYLAKQKRFLDAAPYFMLQCFFILILGKPWHFGLLLIALIGILWIEWPGEETRRARIWSALLLCALLAVSLEQICWSTRAIATDLHGNYAGDKQAAEFLKQHIAGKKVAGFQPHSVGVLPYFTANIFENQHKEGFWYWSQENHTDDRVMETVRDHPDFIVIGYPLFPCQGHDGSVGFSASTDIDRPEIEERILETGAYMETHRFCGDAFSGNGFHMTLCQAILEPAARRGL